MRRLEIIGGKRLSGTVKINGAKNEALKVIALSILIDNELVVENVPRINDVLTMLKIMGNLGAKYKFEGHTLKIDARHITSSQISIEATKLRASIVLVGPLLARFGKVSCPQPGGCLIGARAVKTHLDAFKQLGAKVKIKDCNLRISLDKLKNTVVFLKEKSVTATENIAIFAAGVRQKIKINNCAIEPEIVELLKIIRRAGAKVEGIGKREIVIRGQKSLSISKITIIPDRIEAASYMIALIATGGEGQIEPFPKNDLREFLKILKKCGAKFKVVANKAFVYKNTYLKSFEIKTAPYPGFPTDLQSPMSLVAARAKGVSSINEALYENRLGHLHELEKMGLKVKILDAHMAEISGPAELHPTIIKSLDLRSGITLLLAALMTKGKSIIRNPEIIDRGYENVIEKLIKLGAKVRSAG